MFLPLFIIFILTMYMFIKYLINNVNTKKELDASRDDATREPTCWRETLFNSLPSVACTVHSSVQYTVNSSVQYTVHTRLQYTVHSSVQYAVHYTRI